MTDPRRWLDSPRIVAQAIALRRSAPRSPEAGGPRHGIVGAGQVRRLLAVGDSIAAGVGAPTLDRALVGQTALALATELACAIQWRVIGASGLSSSTLLERLRNVENVGPVDYGIVSIGVNDVTRLVPKRRYRANVLAIADWLEGLSPTTVAVFGGLPPMGQFPLLPEPLRGWLADRSSELDRTLAEALSERERTSRLPMNRRFPASFFAADGFHPSPAGYTQYGSEMAAALRAIERPLS